MNSKTVFFLNIGIGALCVYHMGYFTALGYSDKAWQVAIVAIIASIILMKLEKKK